MRYLLFPEFPYAGFRPGPTAGHVRSLFFLKLQWPLRCRYHFPILSFSFYATLRLHIYYGLKNCSEKDSHNDFLHIMALEGMFYEKNLV
jgi:hypothetical protein